MERDRVVGVGGERRGSGYLIATHLVLTSAHVVSEVGTTVTVFQPGRRSVYSGLVAWRGIAGGRDDAALIKLIDSAWDPPLVSPVMWGRTVTFDPGLACRTWGLPDFVQRDSAPADLEQPRGTINPGDRYVADKYVVHLDTYPPTPAVGKDSPWEGMSGAAVFCGGLLVGVIAVDAAHREHAGLEAVPAYVLLADAGFRAAVAELAGEDGLRCEAIELQELMDHQSPLNRSTSVRTPASLLTARRAMVPFQGRSQLLGQLQQWAEVAGLGVWLLHGRGGQGKTRLAHHFGECLSAQGWAVVWLDPGASAERLRVVAQVRTNLLVVVDYAETRPSQACALLSAVARLRADRTMKILLLARTAGAWWQQLAIDGGDVVAEIVDHANVSLLGLLDNTAEERQQTYNAAAESFRRALPDLLWQDGTDLPVPDGAAAAAVGVEQDLTVLGVQMHALVDVLDAAALGHGGAENRGRRALEARVLDHERGYWKKTARAQGLLPELPIATLTDVVAATVVLGPPNPERLGEVLRRVPDLSDQSRLVIASLRDWLMSLYPGQGPGMFDGLAPDRVAEHLIGMLLIDRTRPCIIYHLAAAISDSEAERLLVVCARATAHTHLMPDAGRRLTAMCIEYHETLLPAALRVAIQVETPDPLIAALEHLASDQRTDIELLIQHQDSLPVATQILARPAISLSRAIVARLRTSSNGSARSRALLAVSLYKMALWQDRAGQFHEALSAANEAVEIQRGLTETRAADGWPTLAKCLATLAALLGTMMREDESLDVATESVEIYRRLVADDPETYRIDLGAALYTLARQLHHSGKGALALAAAAEAVSTVRSAIETHPNIAKSRLAGCLIGLGAQLHDAGQNTEALAAGTEALSIYRELAKNRPDAYLADLASGLNNMSIWLRGLDRGEQALESAAEAIAIQRVLVCKYPESNLPNLASSLYNLATRQFEAGQPDEAFDSASEAVGILRSLAEINQEAYELKLASSLHNFAHMLIELNRGPEARDAVSESVDIHRRLAAKNPRVYSSYLAICLNTLGRQQMAEGCAEKAVAAENECVEIQRALALVNPREFLPNLALFLLNLATFLHKVGMRDAALNEISEAIDICSEFSEGESIIYDDLAAQAHAVREEIANEE
ncbi:tetratricopeptide repeat protein [Nocardia sp. CA-128927]|uniref:tetratricopeptide repeat protein n=1 Tax=Nocardia sp. CA-128927 TaxID=3239975 RepID=UPI003D9783EE